MSIESSPTIPRAPQSGEKVLIEISPEAVNQPASQPTDFRRFHALDSLRAAMVLLGIVVHAGLSYSHMPQSQLWPFKNAQATVVADAVMTASGLFRMPVFFVLAGFFAALIYEKRGRTGLLRDRFRRIALPFLVGWLTMFPLIRAGFVYANSRAVGLPPASAWAGVARTFRSGAVFAEASPIHLWFLEYLMIYYGLALAVLGVPRVRPWLLSVAHRFGKGPLGPALLTAGPLMATPMGLIPAPLSFVPEPVSLTAHAIAFTFGWALFGQSETLRGLGRRAGVCLILALGSLPIGGMALRLRCQVLPPGAFGALPPGAEQALASGPFPQLAMAPGSTAALGVGLGAQAVLACSSALTTWLLVVGVTGLFVRYLDRPIGGVRYVADASYWLYLAHFPLVVWIPIALGGLSLSAVSKLGLVVAASIGSLLAIREAGRLVTARFGIRPSRRARSRRVPRPREHQGDAPSGEGKVTLQPVASSTLATL